MGTLKRGEVIANYSLVVGIEEDRPKKLIEFIKGGGGNGDQLVELLSIIISGK